MSNSPLSSSAPFLFRSGVRKCGTHFKKRDWSSSDSVNRRCTVSCETPTCSEIEGAVQIDYTAADTIHQRPDCRSAVVAEVVN
jgi:hypothetical protein